MFGSRKILNKEKKCKGKYFFIVYVWFSKNLRENVNERKYKGKIKGKKK